jgi:hypothetical protein
MVSYLQWNQQESGTNGRGKTYKIRLTNQIRNSGKYWFNDKLGLVVTGDINNYHLV